MRSEQDTRARAETSTRAAARARSSTNGAAALGARFSLPDLRALQIELDERLARIPTRINEYGVDPFGATPAVIRRTLLPAALVYRHWFRVETHDIDRVPEGRVLLIGNHAGNIFAWDGAMLALSLLLDGEPPRMVRGMAEYFLPKIPFFGTLMHQSGSVVGTPENCRQLLEHDEAIMVFPEGSRGFVKPYTLRYQLQRFGLGFLRLALETDTPIVPVGIVGGEEHNPGLADIKWLGRLIDSPAFPITVGFPWLGLAGALPLPVKFHMHFGEPVRFDGDANDEDARIQHHVDVVKDALRDLIQRGRDARLGWFR